MGDIFRFLAYSIIGLPYLEDVVRLIDGETVMVHHALLKSVRYLLNIPKIEKSGLILWQATTNLFKN